MGDTQLRYPLKPHRQRRETSAWDPERLRRWLPVDQYVGGPEHAVMHLLYVRFFTRALYRLGHIDFEEPFTHLIHQGVITSQGARMSKSRGNVILPEPYVEEFGSDTLRTYLMFGFSYSGGGEWDPSGIQAMFRYLSRVHRFLEKRQEELQEAANRADDVDEPTLEELRYTRHHSICRATQDLERFHFNTAIARHMEFTNALYGFSNDVDPGKWGRKVFALVQDWVRLLGPFAPHFGEELWEMLGGEGNVFDQRWPEWDESILRSREITVVIQVNGKVRDRMRVARGTDRDALAQAARGYGRIPDWLEGKEIRNFIVVPDRLVNIVT